MKILNVLLRLKVKYEDFKRIINSQRVCWRIESEKWYNVEKTEKWYNVEKTLLSAMTPLLNDKKMRSYNGADTKNSFSEKVGISAEIPCYQGQSLQGQRLQLQGGLVY